MVKSDFILKAIEAFIDEAVETKEMKTLIKLRDRARRDNVSNPSLPVSSLKFDEVQTCLKLVRVTNDPELDTVPSRALPHELVKHLNRIRKTNGRSEQNEAIVRWNLNTLVTFAHEIATAQDIAPIKPISVQCEKLWTIGPVILKDKKWDLTGRPDYSVWYGEEEDVSLNVIIVEAKRSFSASQGVPQALAYMGLVHKLRKENCKQNCTVYGVSCDGDLFHFLKINDNSEWSERVVLARNQEYAQVFGFLVFFMGRALALSPTSSAQSSRLHSKESTAQTHSRQGSTESNVSFDTQSPMDETQ